jgi:hypothetical protein
MFTQAFASSPHHHRGGVATPVTGMMRGEEIEPRAARSVGPRPRRALELTDSGRRTRDASTAIVDSSTEMAMTRWLGDLDWSSCHELATPGGFFVIFFGGGRGRRPGGARRADYGVGPRLAFPILALIGSPTPASRFWPDCSRPPRPGLDGHRGAVPVAPIEPGPARRAELRGTLWAAHNVSPTVVIAGQRCRVVAVNGLQLDIRPE